LLAFISFSSIIDYFANQSDIFNIVFLFLVIGFIISLFKKFIKLAIYICILIILIIVIDKLLNLYLFVS
jgi:hypothetical protein